MAPAPAGGTVAGAVLHTVLPQPAVSDSVRDRLARLVVSAAPWGRWEIEHMHAPLLCALGILEAPDAEYARAARRRFADPAETQERALALIDALDREAREERYELRRRR